MKSLNKDIIVIAGPTASGKSTIANILAKKIDAEIISADSMQVYKGMDIGTGKIAKEEMLVHHWGIDIIEPDKPYSAALFQEYAREAIKKILSKNKNIVICGGTGFYIRAVIDDYQFAPGQQTDNPIRTKWNNFYSKYGAERLWNELNEIDPESAKLIHKNNYVRVLRALEIAEMGESYAVQLNNLHSIKQIYPAKMYALKVEPSINCKRIDMRVEAMIDSGLIEEVKCLLERGYRDSLTASSAIGYKEIVEYLDNNITLDEAVEQIKIHSHQYAKRQRSWFNSDPRYQWIDYNKIDPESVSRSIIGLL